jgi:hypothetical protein
MCKKTDPEGRKMISKSQHVVTILGVGPRGLSILERINAFAATRGTAISKIYLIDPSVPGCGVHMPEQPDHLLINTVASQVTIFPDDTCRNSGPVLPGPSLYDWSREQGYRWTEDGHIIRGEGRDIDQNEYLPRALLGKYLHWAFDKFTKSLSEHCEIVSIASDALELNEKNGGYLIELRNKQTIETDFVFLTTGHSENEYSAKELEMLDLVSQGQKKNPDLSYFNSAYPLARNLSTVRRDHVVAIEGFGLTAMDVISELTINRGGKFQQRNTSGDLVYEPSGNEPKLLVYSRDGFPLSARATNQKGATGQHQAVYFTMAKVKSLKEQYQKLDFEQQVLPLILIEMQLVYYRKLFVQVFKKPESEFSKFLNSNNIIEPDWASAALLFPESLRFNWQKMLNPTEGCKFENSTEFKNWLFDFISDDLNEARRGNETSPIKAACDVLRDTRDTLRACVDFGGLNEESHSHFLKIYSSILNRLAVGPPKERTAQVLALIDAGILQADFGTLPQVRVDVVAGKFQIYSTAFSVKNEAHSDFLIVSRIQPNVALADKSPLMKSMVELGTIRPFLNKSFCPGGIDIDPNFNVIDFQGRKNLSIWALGTIAEGPKYYTFILPRPGVNSTAINDAGKCVQGLLAQIELREGNQYRKAS